MTFRSLFAAVSFALVLSGGNTGIALAHSEEIGTLAISDLWTRATPPRAQAAGGFLTIENSGREPDRLTGAASPVAGRVEIHQMRMQDGIMIMRPVEGGVEIPADGEVILAPGGFHIMFMDLNEAFTEGETVPMTLHFEKAGDLETSLHVLGLGARGPETERHMGNPEHGSGQ